MIKGGDYKFSCDILSKFIYFSLKPLHKSDKLYPALLEQVDLNGYFIKLIANNFGGSKDMSEYVGSWFIIMLLKEVKPNWFEDWICRFSKPDYDSQKEFGNNHISR